MPPFVAQSQLRKSGPAHTLARAAGESIPKEEPAAATQPLSDSQGSAQTAQGSPASASVPEGGELPQQEGVAATEVEGRRGRGGRRGRAAPAPVKVEAWGDAMAVLRLVARPVQQQGAGEGAASAAEPHGLVATGRLRRSTAGHR